MINVTTKQLEILRHTLGIQSKSPGYRNRYVTQIDDVDVNALVDMGLMSGPFYAGEFGDGMAMFTASGTTMALMNVKRFAELEKLKDELTRQRNDYREFWLSKNTMHSWERDERIAEDAADLMKVLNEK